MSLNLLKLRIRKAKSLKLQRMIRAQWHYSLESVSRAITVRNKLHRMEVTYTARLIVVQ